MKMPRVYNVSVYLDIHTVSCPGVWLCPKGKAFLKICLFGVSDLTKEVDPFFPLVFKERFHFQKAFKNVNSVYELHDKLARSIISLELLQCPIGSAGCVKLALFNALLSDILHPYATCFSKPLHTSGLELLFTTCKVFPGILAPKADVSIKVMVADTADSERRAKTKPLRSKSVNDDDRRRQQKVCHTKNNTNCKCFGSNDEQSNEVKASRSGDASSSDETSGISLPDVEESRRKPLEKDVVTADSDRKETIRRRPFRNDSDENENVRSNERLNNEVMLIDGYRERETSRMTNVPRHFVSAGRSIGARRDDTGGPQGMSFIRSGQDDASYGRRDEYQQQQAIIDWRVSDGSRAQETSQGMYPSERVISCDRLLKEREYNDMLRTNDKVLRDRYFKCFKERSENERTQFHGNRERAEVSNYDKEPNMTRESQFGRDRRRSAKGKGNEGCTCLRSVEKRNKASTKTATIRNSHERNSRERLNIDGYTNHRIPLDAVPPSARDQSISMGERYDVVSHRNDFNRHIRANDVPPTSKYYNEHYSNQGGTQKIRSRSDMDVTGRNDVQSFHRPISGHQHDYEKGRLESSELQAGEMPPRPRYKDEVRSYQEPSSYQTHKPVGGQFIPSTMYETHGGRGDRVHENDSKDHSTHPEPMFVQIPVSKGKVPHNDRQVHSLTDTRQDVVNVMASDNEVPARYRIGGRSAGVPHERSKTHPQRSIRRSEDSRHDDKNTMPPFRANPEVSSNYKASDRPSDERHQRSINVISSKPDDKPNYALDKGVKLADSSSESDDEECRCPLCKSYQRKYNPDVHPCPRFKKKGGLSNKVRHSKSNNGLKKLIPSRRSTVTYNHKVSSRKTNARFKNTKECDFAKCDSVDHEYIGYKKDIKKFYKNI